MNMLGSRIRNLRKEKKLTLEALAGDYMTKGMLSLIENNKNNPSMESLEYIAERLGTSVSALLEDGSEVTTNNIYNEIKQILKVPNISYQKEIDGILSPIINEIQHNRKGAFIFKHYAFTKARINDVDNAVKYMNKAKSIYADNDDINELIEVERDYASIYYLVRDYDKALQHAITTYENYKDDLSVTNPNIIPNLLVSIGTFCYQNYDIDDCIKYFKLAEEKCIENKTYKHLTPIYKSLCVMYILNQDETHYTVTYKKFDNIKQLNPDDFQTNFDIFTTDIIYYFFNEEYHKLLHLLDQRDTLLKHNQYQQQVNDNFEAFWSLYKAIALYNLQQYDSAVSILNSDDADTEFTALADVSIHAQKYTYLALNEERLGNHKSACDYIIKAMGIIKSIPSNHFTQITEQTYERIINESL
ncbi:helix-turn-helix transcriptional regulator [Macrococcus caseolyticus]|uniref:helix-turn-helix domain-containing protein n=1 Tax=Macrococcoides caseolyticum TaxID=69966 RepID=UPI0024BD1A36|nr:helix-turn-helix transcriptional regulator [Macrococcus caseolyticus]MDJ1156193.1 helix-turn-helix transcriptional regulator [Macrococcus caseolyticus]MEB8171808.1 helix-turn-helix domain-containing protein [Macrococcus caseolyticus]